MGYLVRLPHAVLMREKEWGGGVSAWIAVLLLVAITNVPGSGWAASQPNPCPLAFAASTASGAPVRPLASSPPNPTNPCPGQEWATAYGGALAEAFNAVVQTPDGGYIAAGYTNSFGVGGSNVWVVKLGSMGDVQWQKTYGGTGGSGETAYAVQPTLDGGYVVAGYADAGSQNDVWVLKLDSLGSVLWQKKYGGPASDWGYAIAQTSDGGYVVGSYTGSSAGGLDLWVLRLDPYGNVLWQKAVGSTSHEWLLGAGGMTLDPDGGIVLAGRVDQGSNGPVGLVVRLDASGNIVWSRTFGTGNVWTRSVLQTADGGYLAAGNAGSTSKLLVMRLDGTGSILWQKTYTGGFAVAVGTTPDGGYAVLGRVSSTSKIGAGGNPVWERTYGGADIEDPRALWSTSEGGFIMAGYTYSFGQGLSDAWLVKTAPNGSLVTTCPSGIAAQISAGGSNSRLGASPAAMTSTTSAASISNTSVVALDSAATTMTQCTA